MTSRNPNGLSDKDCCSNDNNKQTVNIAHYTIRNPYQTHCLAGYSNYCNPVYTHDATRRSPSSSPRPQLTSSSTPSTRPSSSSSPTCPKHPGGT
mmetsp:Transcript_13189/g.27970  ORF Transcript_13189/g.27970 Transcript_13189/m.27970 type:complete len:94 (-) Transcript_13189:403-684(-)